MELAEMMLIAVITNIEINMFGLLVLPECSAEAASNTKITLVLF